MESDMVDSNVVRLNKFRLINKKGHASHSSIQDLMYYETAQEEDNSYGKNIYSALLIFHSFDFWATYHILFLG